jgi:flavin-dependent dehydrogenase
VIIVGGGPAGSAAAAWLARSGHRVTLFERDQFPRFHIGESLLASVNDVLGAIGADELVRRAGFPQKWGATFMTGRRRTSNGMPTSALPRVCGLHRPGKCREATFDDLLLRHAATSGADVRERHRIVDVAFESGRRDRVGPHAGAWTVDPRGARSSNHRRVWSWFAALA